MRAAKHRADASERIEAHFAALPEWSRKICTKLRKLVLSADPELTEDWKWGPNYSLKGMVCGIISTKKYVSLVFFRGTQLRDRKKLLQGNPENLNIKSFRFTNVSEIEEPLLLEYIFEAIDNNRLGIKPLKRRDKTVILPADVKRAFKKSGVLGYFESLPYSHRKEYVAYIGDAKKEETKLKRIDKAISKMSEKQLREVMIKKTKKH